MHVCTYSVSRVISWGTQLSLNSVTSESPVLAFLCLRNSGLEKGSHSFFATTSMLIDVVPAFRVRALDSTLFWKATLSKDRSGAVSRLERERSPTGLESSTRFPSAEKRLDLLLYCSCRLCSHSEVTVQQACHLVLPASLPAGENGTTMGRHHQQRQRRRGNPSIWSSGFHLNLMSCKPVSSSPPCSPFF